jgi:uncharacterized protein YecT (DUF1311 family)
MIKSSADYAVESAYQLSQNDPQRSVLIRMAMAIRDLQQQQRTWVGLTDDERYEIANVPRWSSGAFVEATETKLKEKNT